MLLKGVIEIYVKIPNEVALALYLQCQPLSFAESFLPLLSEIAFNEDAAKVAFVASGILNIKDSYKEDDKRMLEMMKVFNAYDDVCMAFF